jgi:hypothetical protein
MQPDNLVINTAVERTVELKIDGLALCCFNHAGWWEVAFLREPSHTLKIYIEEKNQATGQGSGAREVQMQDGLVRLQLEVQNGSNAHYAGDMFRDGFFFNSQSRPFSRGVGDHPNDFKWVIDFVGGEIPHGNFRALKRPDKFPVTLLKIPHSLFYTEALSESPLLLVPLGTKDQREGEILGHTNEKVGVHVFTDPPSSARLIGTDAQGRILIDELLPHHEGRYYEITINNMEEKKRKEVSEVLANPQVRKPKTKLKDFKDGDLDVFYEVIDVTTNDKYDLFGPNPDALFGKLGDCNVVRIGPEAGVENLEPLIS